MTANKIAQINQFIILFGILAIFFGTEGRAQTAATPSLACPGFFQSVKVKCVYDNLYFWDQRTNECVVKYKPPTNVASQLSGLCASPCVGTVTSPEILNSYRVDSMLSLFNECGEVRLPGRCPENFKIPTHEADYQVSCLKPSVKLELVPFDEAE